MPKRVTVLGRNLLRICDQIALRQLPWIRQTDRDFRPLNAIAEGDPIITGIKVETWKRPGKQAAELAESMETLEEA